jgi:dihydropyrimidinase
MRSQAFDLVVRNGTVVTEGGALMGCDIGVTDGTIQAVGPQLPRGREEVDAGSLLVLPGGVDAHCHLAQVSSTGLLTADDFHSGGMSAACGGTTTIVPFAAQHRGQSLREVVEAYHALAKRAFVDYAFHMIVSDPTDIVLGEELPSLVRAGHTSFKVFMTYDALRLTDRQILDVLAVAAREGALTMFHAENHDAIAWITSRLVAEGKTAPKYHPQARPEPVEREAVGRAIALAELVDVPILIVHVSGRQALDEIRRAKARGRTVFAETCPQYLTIAAGDLDRPGFEGAKLMFSPPARDADSQAALWEGLCDGAIDLFSSDHAPYRYDDPKGKKAHGEGAPFTKVANGVPTIELRLPILFSEGVTRGRLDLEAFVRLTAEMPARIYGLYPRKGVIAVGSDADLTMWDPDREVTVTHALLHDRMDYTPFEGLQLRGWPVRTIARGETVMRDGEVCGNEGRGRFIDRVPFAYAAAITRRSIDAAARPAQSIALQDG